MPIIRTIKSFNEHKIKEKNSVFIGQAYPVSSEEEAGNILSEIRRKYYDATHHCYCYKLQDGKFRYSDDGEPSGTAGLRILSAIDHYGLLSILVVVIRYYGGIKLGVGPLGKSYHDSANEVLKTAGVLEKKAYNLITFIVDFDNMNHVFRTLSHHDVKDIKTDYSDHITIDCMIESETMQEIIHMITELTNGNVQIIDHNLCKFI